MVNVWMWCDFTENWYFYFILKFETHTVPEIPKRQRLQEYGVGIFEAFPTKSALKKALKKGYIKVDGVIASTATLISGGEQISLDIPLEITTKKSFEFPLEVLFEDDHLAAIHKPAGIEVSGNKFKTITNALSTNLEPSSLSDASIPQPVHRLDYATTGIVLVGKTASSIRALNKLFEEKKIVKTYYAITIGNMKPNGRVETEIDGKPAQSDYEVMKSVPSDRFGFLNLVKLHPKTGRRHQLRKHLFSIGHPILGDKDYGLDKLILKGQGLYLHAFSLKFEHPFTKRVIYVMDELPEKFGKIFHGKGG